MSPAFGSPTGHQLDAMRVHIPEDIRDGAAILARLGHQRSKCLSNVRGIAATVRKRLDVALAPYTSLIARAWIDALPSICRIAGSANHGKIASISRETGSGHRDLRAEKAR